MHLWAPLPFDPRSSRLRGNEHQPFMASSHSRFEPPCEHPLKRRHKVHSRVPNAPFSVHVPVLLLATTLTLLLGCADPPDSEALYRTHCASCHALDGRGDPRRLRDTPALDLSRSPLVENRLDGRIYRLIEGGVGGMPGFSHKMEWQEMQAVARYTLELVSEPNNGDQP